MKKSYKIPGFKVFLMLISFALAFLDMNMLKGSIETILNVSGTMPSILAVAIATIANCLALDWGISNANSGKNKFVSKESAIGFSGWLVFGLVYYALKLSELSDVLLNMEEDLIPFIIELIVLTASYIFSGLSIAASAKEIFNADASACRSAENTFTELHRLVAKEDAKINHELGTLEGYDEYYKATKKQYLRHKKAILNAEKSVCNEILGETLLENSDIDPSIAHEILNEVLARRERETKEILG